MKAPPAGSAARSRGVALLLVLVSVMVLSLVVVSLWESSQPSWEEGSLERARFQAGLLAESGLAVALHPDAAPGDEALRQSFGPDRGFEARIVSEGGRLPVNRLADDRYREAALEMFVLWGVDAASASHAADSLADWIDTDDEARPNGAERDHYAALGRPEYPPNSDFTSLDEMMLVAGMDRIARFQPLWRDYFTLYSEDGLVDLNSAPWELVAALTRATRDSALNFVAVRNGADGIPATADDYRFQDFGEVQALLGLSQSEWDEVFPLITLSGSVKRIESTGRVGTFVETRVILANETEQNGRRAVTPLARFRE